MSTKNYFGSKHVFTNRSSNGNVLLTAGQGEILLLDGAISLEDGKIYVGDANDISSAVTLSGDATLSNTGELTLDTVNISSGSTTLSSVTTNDKGLVTSNTSATLANANIWVGDGDTPSVPTARAMSGDATLGNTGALTLATVNGAPASTTLSSVTTNAKGLVTSNTSAALTSANFWLGNVSNVPTPVVLSGDATINNLGALTLGTVAVTKGGTGLTTFDQGDLLYASAEDVISALPKDTNATRYLANTGASNSPGWNRIDLANGVSGNLPVGNLGAGIASSSSTFFRGDATWVNPLVNAGAGSADTPSISFAADPDTGLYNTTNALLVATNGVNRMSVGTTTITTSLPVVQTTVSFLGGLSGSNSNVTGDATAFTIPYDQESYDKTSNFNISGGIFTTPFAGTYTFSAGATLQGLLVGHTFANLSFEFSSFGSITVARCNPYAISTGGEAMMQGSLTIYLAASQNVTVKLTVSGSTKSVDLNTGYSWTYFTGTLVN